MVRESYGSPTGLTHTSQPAPTPAPTPRPVLELLLSASPHLGRGAAGCKSCNRPGQYGSVQLAIPALPVCHLNGHDLGVQERNMPRSTQELDLKHQLRTHQNWWRCTR
ncbi:expressed unknown protein [Seminavis robusta]|uniref:Uncharacterized protein n=1 Tax=Seminavis robusta TaxID=568900 RepID=A0A9N8HQU7_9STRA|nr:expressed unknown protein [Seminavis robusta]|eukprot:Sro1196_g251471.1  (108) ;mRNA; r:14578-14901